MSSRMSCTPRSRRRRYCRIRLSGSPAMSRLGQLEAALDPLDPSVQAIQPPVHAEQPLLDAQDLAPEVELPLLDPGHPPLQVTDRSAERRVGKECVRPCNSSWWPYH